MTTINVKGHEIIPMRIGNSFGRRAQKFKNNIIANLKELGLTEDDVSIDLEPMAIKNLPAEVAWYVEGNYLHFSCNSQTKYVENLFIVSKVIEFEIKRIIEGKKTIQQFIEDFSEEEDDKKDRKEARKLLGVDVDSMDLTLISKKYKELARKVHPDMPEGNTEKFKALNNAHKILKRELE